MATRIPDGHLDMAVRGRTRSEYSFMAIMMTARIFPQKMLETKIYKTTLIPQIMGVIIKYKKGEHILIKSFCSSFFGTTAPAKRNACKAACDYITRNFMDKLKQLDEDTLRLNNGSDGDQHDDGDHNDGNMVDLPHVEGVPEGEPTAIRDEFSDSDVNITRTHH
jgi:hypothetical protein